MVALVNEAVVAHTAGYPSLKRKLEKYYFPYYQINTLKLQQKLKLS
jgi:hypothetical protein